VDALVVLTAEDTEFRNPSGRSLHGREAVERIVEAASKARVWLFRRGTETLSRANGTMRIDTPVVELVGGSETDGTPNVELRDGELTAFAVCSELLRAAARLAAGVGGVSRPAARVGGDHDGAGP
jgi:hypothetical protein